MRTFYRFALVIAIMFALFVNIFHLAFIPTKRQIREISLRKLLVPLLLIPSEN